MPIHRVLVMQSVEDAITDKRKHKIENNPALADYQFAFCYAVELSYDQKAIPIPIMVNQVSREPFDTNKLIARLGKHIRAFNPDLLVVHFGFVFEAFPNEILTALKTIRTEFPNVKFGLRNAHLQSLRLDDIKTVFDGNAETLELVEKIFSFERPRDLFINMTPPLCLN